MSRQRLVVVRLAASALALVVGVALPPAAWAGAGQPEAAPKDTDPVPAAGGEAPRSDADEAKALAQKGRSLYWDGDYRQAIEAFSTAYDLVADPNLLYNISAAYEKLGEYDRALEYQDRYGPDAPAEERDAISARRRELERAQAQAAGPGDPDPGPAPGGPVGTPEPPPPEEEPPREPVMGALGWSLVGVAGAGLAVGAGFGIAALTQSGDGRDRCFDDAGSLRCPTSAQTPLEAARRNAIIADVGFGVAVLATAAVLTVLGVRLQARKRDEAGKADVSLRGLGATVRF